MIPTVLVTGSTGLIGQYLVKTAARWAPRWNVQGVARAELDLTDRARVDAVWQSIKPDAVIHCAAISRTKDCEDDPAQARRVNVEATAHLAHLARDVPFFFLSSGEVFDGRKGWYVETDEAAPLNVYGRTKLEAERIVLRNPGHTVLRIVLTAGRSINGDRSFVEDMCRAAQSGQAVRLYADEFRCPLPAGVIVRVIWALLEARLSGLYHLGGSERLSRWEIGEALVSWYPELAGRLVAGSARAHAGAPRPADLSLRCDRLQAQLSFPLPGFRTWLAGRSRRETDLWDYEPTDR